MAMKIDKKITGYGVVSADDPGKVETASDRAFEDAVATATAEVIQMHEKVERPDTLIGATYKIKSPLFEHALYVTINDIVLNAGTEHELRRPFEIFINSKNMDHFQWIVALTRIMSAVFRKGGDVTFLVEELKAVFDPRGGYFKAGGVYMPSIVAELGAIVEQHLKMIGLLHDPELDEGARKLIAEKRAAYEARTKKNSRVSADAASASPTEKPSSRRKPATGSSSENSAGAGATSAGAASAAMPSSDTSVETPVASDSTFPAGATMCAKCSTTAVILMDGCATCLNCGYSKCG
jgi:hypothetical protein